MKKRILLPLIFILFLLFTLTGYCAWLSGWDNRIKLTIDQTKIDTADLTGFPVTVFLTAANGHEIFTELDTDAEYLKVAFTKTDGTTELYAECELYDVSESKGIYHVSKSDWVIDYDADTDFYMYYDKDHADNTTYIGTINTAAGGNVWDNNFKMVQHMVDLTDYEIVNACDAGTDWGNIVGGNIEIDTADKHSGTGSLKIVTNAAEGYVAYDPAGHWNWSAKTYMKVWMKGDTAESGELFIFDHNSNWERWAFTYPTSWTLMEFDLSSPTSDDGTGLGDWTDIELIRFDVNANGKTARFDEIRIYPGGTINVMDSTSNYNYGTKVGAGEPASATGKVGLGQNFDGSNDYINHGIGPIITSGGITISLLIKSSAIGQNKSILSKRYVTGGDWCNYGISTTNIAAYKLRFWYTKGNGVYSEWDTTSSASTLGVLDNNWHHLDISLTYGTGASILCYIDGASVAGGWISGDGSDLPSGRSASEILTIGSTVGGVSLMTGLLDEVSIATVARTTGWMKATYNSLWDTLLTYGSGEISVNAILFGIDF